MKEQWCFPTVGVDFVWRMEHILDLYARPYDRDQPVVCFDERPCQLIGEKRVATAPQPGRPERYDYEYERQGTCNLFGFFQPLQNWRHLKAAYLHNFGLLAAFGDPFKESYRQ